MPPPHVTLRCRRCGRDTSGITDRCPKCGEPFATDDIRGAREPSRVVRERVSRRQRLLVRHRRSPLAIFFGIAVLALLVALFGLVFRWGI